MPKYQRCPETIIELAAEILTKFETHKALLDARVSIDYLFAYGEADEKTGIITSPAIMHHGQPAHGLCRIVNLRDRAKGLRDAEIQLDADHWEQLSGDEKAALLDHELHHIDPTGDVDDIGRPKIRLRKHDAEFGWFKVIAARHGAASAECIQAEWLMEQGGQYFWPQITDPNELNRITSKWVTDQLRITKAFKDLRSRSRTEA